MDEVAGAIADPVRRDILLMLRDEPLSAGQIADRFVISRPAVSRHLRVLREAGLVRDTADGRRRVYTLVTAPLGTTPPRARIGWIRRSPMAISTPPAVASTDSRSGHPKPCHNE